ncbi:MAG TPA: ECF-type sigma factor [Polyangiales bacterium]|nr:ECF-type sigma factor [Polyangiales bacterium]
MAEDAGDAGRLSVLLGRAREGDPQAFQAVFEAAYPELRALARARLRRQQPGGGPGGLETTALVHEAYLRFAGSELAAQHRAHFFRYASRVMRSVIVDAIRERAAQRRGGGSPHDELSSQIAPLRDGGGEEEVLKVHEALDGLADYDPRLVDVVHMRYFGGMTDREIASVLDVTERTVRRDWEKARLLLLEALEP